MLLYFNRDLFARAGLAEPNESWTWEKDFLDGATRLKAFMAGAVAEPTFQLTFGADLRNSLVTSWGVTSSTRRARRPPWRKRRPWRAGVRPRAALPPALRRGARPGGRRHLQQRPHRDERRRQLRLRRAPQRAVQARRHPLPQGPGGRRQTGNATGYSITEGSKNKPARVGVRQVAGGGQRAGAPGPDRDHHPRHEEGLPPPRTPRPR